MNISKSTKNIKEEWLDFFESKRDMLVRALNNVYFNNHRVIFPFKKNIFRIFKYITPKEAKVVLIGQDPYIGSEIIDDVKIPQAEGFSFSVPKSHKKIPPSLKNMYKEIQNSYPEAEFKHGNLKRWVKEEKVFLLNSSLTVVEGISNSHQQYWRDFTDEVIKHISNVNDGTVFILMGSYAISKKKLIDTNKHAIVQCVHPSPLSAHRGFFGSKIFEKTNEELVKRNKKGIKWAKNIKF